MTELQWLIKMLTQHKLSVSLKDLFIQRIGEVEAQLSKATIVRAQSNSSVNPFPTQAPSMQRIIEEVSAEGMIAMPPQTSPRTIVQTEVVTGKGNGTFTKGPRKF